MVGTLTGDDNGKITDGTMIDISDSTDEGKNMGMDKSIDIDIDNHQDPLSMPAKGKSIMPHVEIMTSHNQASAMPTSAKVKTKHPPQILIIEPNTEAYLDSESVPWPVEGEDGKFLTWPLTTCYTYTSHGRVASTRDTSSMEISNGDRQLEVEPDDVDNDGVQCDFPAWGGLTLESDSRTASPRPSQDLTATHTRDEERQHSGKRRLSTVTSVLTSPTRGPAQSPPQRPPRKKVVVTTSSQPMPSMTMSASREAKTLTSRIAVPASAPVPRGGRVGGIAVGSSSRGFATQGAGYGGIISSSRGSGTRGVSRSGR